MFRVPADYYQGINRACLAAHTYETELLAYAFMSNHFHIIAKTNNPSGYISSIRNGYTKWFNHKYCRKGSLGTRSFHAVTLVGYEHTLEAVTYVLRNAVHHKVNSYPSGYPFCSARYYFIKELGIQNQYVPINGWDEQRKVLSIKKKLPKGYILDKTGLLVQENILKTKIVEQLYGSPRKFMFYMNKLSGEEKVLLQVESWMGKKAHELLENNKLANSNRISDVDVCQYIDLWLKKNKKGAPYTALSVQEKLNLGRLLKRKGVGSTQAARCLALDPVSKIKILAVNA